MPHTIDTLPSSIDLVPNKESHAHEAPKRKRPPRNVHSWLEGPYDSARGESALWVAVITQAVMDALSRSRNPEQLYHKRMATQWLTENNKDFMMVCLMAGLDPNDIRRKAKKAIFSPVPWRAAPGEGKRYLERKSYRERLKKRSMKTCATMSPPPGSQNALILNDPWNN